ncbi:MAG: hypothetical protein MR563_00530 [Spirochaetales bacterium]|nr:hypothetical protein [Spirochaetales bacterium]
MKKFSVLFVAMLIALMLFVGCENKPKERAATADDAKVFYAIYGGAMKMSSENPARKGVTLDEKTLTVTYDNAKMTAEENPMKVAIVLCGKATASYSEDKTLTAVLDFTNGTSVGGKAHTLYAKMVVNKDEPSKYTAEIILDGYKLTDLDKVKID